MDRVTEFTYVKDDGEHETVAIESYNKAEIKPWGIAYAFQDGLEFLNIPWHRIHEFHTAIP